MGLIQYSDDGFFVPRKIADAFRTTSEEVARTAGLGKDAIQRKERVRSERTQRRLREMVEIINKTEPRFGSPLMAYAWYCSEPLPGFSGFAHRIRFSRANRCQGVARSYTAVDSILRACRRSTHP